MTRFTPQSAIVFFILIYGYFSPSARDDGYGVSRIEFSTTMVISAAIVANLFNGLNTRFWTGWVFFAVFVGIVLIFAYTVCFYLTTCPAVSRSNSLFTGPLFDHLSRMVRHLCLWQRPLFVQIRHLLVGSSHHGATLAPPTVPLHGMELRLQPH